MQNYVCVRAVFEDLLPLWEPTALRLSATERTSQKVLRDFGESSVRKIFSLVSCFYSLCGSISGISC